jgi:hypothetical protein
MGFEVNGIETLLKLIPNEGQQEIVESIGSFEQRYNIFEFIT